MLADRADALDRLYELLDELAVRIGGPRRLVECDGRMVWPRRGVYFFFETGEKRSNGTRPRIVRVGTHALSSKSRTTLWQRLSQHRGTSSGSMPGRRKPSRFDLPPACRHRAARLQRMARRHQGDVGCRRHGASLGAGRRIPARACSERAHWGDAVPVARRQRPVNRTRRSGADRGGVHFAAEQRQKAADRPPVAHVARPLCVPRRGALLGTVEREPCARCPRPDLAARARPSHQPHEPRALSRSVSPLRTFRSGNREHVLGARYGSYRAKGVDRPRGSLLHDDAIAARPGLNFLSPTSAAYAAERSIDAMACGRPRGSAQVRPSAAAH